LILRAFIQANSKQLLGAKIAKSCLELNSNIKAEIINVDTLDLGLNDLRYKRNGTWQTYKSNDLQSFTLVRFLPPSLLNFKGYALVIDPDIFALGSLDDFINEISDLSFDIIACEKKQAYDSSVMVMNCANLRMLAWDKIIHELRSGSLDYLDSMSLNLNDLKIASLDRRFNSLDYMDDSTVLLHTTNRLTQPWKTGLRIDFTRNSPGFLGPIPRKPFLKLAGKWPSRYRPHPNRNIEKAFFALTKKALISGYIEENDIRGQILQGNVRKDFMKCVGDL